MAKTMAMAALTALMAAMPATSGAAPSGAAATAAVQERSDPAVSITRHVVALKDGRRLSYTARAGFLPLINDATGEVAAQVSFVAYAADRPAGAPPRPITFVFPGGPGGAATLAQAGPLRVETTGGQARVSDNPDTLLSSTDLVFVDPVGSGYSRVTKPQFTSLFYSIKGDRDALVEVVRLYLQRYDPAESPIFLSGGSYGSIRSILVADAALARGIPIRGIMVSAEGASLSIIGTDTAMANLIPGFAVAAQAHHKLPPDLQADRAKAIAEAKTWAYDVYLPALAKGNTLSAEARRQVAVQMARYSGLKPEVIEAHNLRITAEQFANELLRDQGQSIGFYDTRIAGPAQTGEYDPTKDPSLAAHGNAYPSLAERYLLNRTLGLVSDRYYAGPFGGGWPVREGFEDWMSIKWGMGLEEEPVGLGVEIVLPTLLRLVDRGMPVMFGEGYYDWACPPFGVDYVASRVPPAQKDRVEVHHYESGHAVPTAQFDADASAFIARALRQPGPKPPHPILD